MKIPKAIFVDIDGTLLSHTNRRVPKSAVEALHYARDKGVRLFVATGRSKLELGKIAHLDEIPFDGYVTMNGAFCYAGNEVVFKNPLRSETVAAVIERIAKNPFPCMFCEENELYINVKNEYVQKLQESLSLPLPPVGDIYRALDNDIYLIAAFGITPEEASFLHSLEHSKVTRWMEGGYDMVNGTVNKWEGISHMLSRFGIAPSEAAAIGDEQNDIEMLTNAGYSVAMGNAIDAVKECADFVTAHVDDDGLAKAVEHLLALGN